MPDDLPMDEPGLTELLHELLGEQQALRRAVETLAWRMERLDGSASAAESPLEAHQRLHCEARGLEVARAHYAKQSPRRSRRS